MEEKRENSQKVDLSSFDNSWYDIGAGKLKQTLWYYINVVFFLNPWVPFSGAKSKLLRLFGAKVGRGVVIKPHVNIKYPWKLQIGDHSWIGEDVWIDNLAEVKIGSNCCLSQGSMILCGNHNYKSTSFDLIVKPIHIDDGAWIGAQSTVCPGVTCNSHSILSVGSVATADLQANTIYSGVPAVEIRKRNIG